MKSWFSMVIWLFLHASVWFSEASVDEWPSAGSSSNLVFWGKSELSGFPLLQISAEQPGYLAAMLALVTLWFMCFGRKTKIRGGGACRELVCGQGGRLMLCSLKTVVVWCILLSKNTFSNTHPLEMWNTIEFQRIFFFLNLHFGAGVPVLLSCL